jgi:hypothetical protein
MEDKMSTQKQCKVCKQDKPFAEFNKNASSKDGYSYTCKACIPVKIILECSEPFGHVKLEYKKGTEYYLTGEINRTRIDKTFPYKDNGGYHAYEEFYTLESYAKFGVDNTKKCDRCGVYKPLTVFQADSRKNGGYHICNQCTNEEEASLAKYRAKVAEEGLYYTIWFDADGKGWHNVHVKDDGTILKNGVIMKKGRSSLNQKSTKNQGIGCISILCLGLVGLLIISRILQITLF